MLPILLAIAILFAYAIIALCVFARRWRQRRRGESSGYELLRLLSCDPSLAASELESVANHRLKLASITSRVAPLLGFVATIGPVTAWLRGHEHDLENIAGQLIIAVSAVLLAGTASIITSWIGRVRRRWYVQDLAASPTPRKRPSENHRCDLSLADTGRCQAQRSS